MIPRYTNPEMGAIWSEQRRYETWLEVELAATDAMAEAGLVPADAARELRARAGFDIARIEAIEQVTQHDVIAFTTAVAEQVGAGGALAALRPDLFRRGRHRAGDPDAAGVRPDRQGHRRADGSGAVARRGTSPHADDRPHPRRARRADDARRQAGTVVRRAAARPRPRAARPRQRRGRQDVRCGRHLRAPRPGHRGAGLRDARPGSRRRCRRR